MGCFGRDREDEFGFDVVDDRGRYSCVGWVDDYCDYVGYVCYGDSERFFFIGDIGVDSEEVGRVVVIIVKFGVVVRIGG